METLTTTSTKRFNIMHNVGAVKHLVNFHDGIKKHQDGSDFFDIRTFTNKEAMNRFVADLRKDGYEETSR